MRRRGIGRRSTGLAGSAARTVGRTALIAGTATAVAGTVAGAQQRQAPPAAPPPPTEPANLAPPRLSDEDVAQLKQLKELHEAGILTDEEFAAKKAHFLGV
jgi:hypothetical protein